MSFLPHYCHSFRSTVIPSALLSFLPDYCHSFQIIAISNIFHPEYLQYPPIPEGREKWPPEVAICASLNKLWLNPSISTFSGFGAFAVCVVGTNL